MKKEYLLGRIEHYKEIINIKERMLERTNSEIHRNEYKKEIKNCNKKIEKWKKELKEVK